MNKKFLSSIYLVIVALIWGLAFVAQSQGMDYLGAFGFSGLRSIVGGIFTIFLMFIIPGFIKLEEERIDSYIDPKRDLKAGIICGVVLFFAMNAQQIGLKYSTPGKAGFITALYIVIIPIIKRFFGHKIEFKVLIGVVLSMVGMYLLSVKGSEGINIGDIVVFISAIFYSIHTLVLAKYTTSTDSLRLNTYQFMVCGVLSIITAIILRENLSVEAILLSVKPILYVGILSSGIAYTLQIVALKNIDSTVAALINSLESIFAALGGWLILGQVLDKRELLGCTIMFIAIIIAQLPDRKDRLHN